VEPFKQYHNRDHFRFWLLLSSIVLLFGQIVCALLILVEEAVIVVSIGENRWSNRDVGDCQMFIGQNATADPIGNFQRKVLFMAQLASNTVANAQLIFVLVLAVRTIHVERGYRSRVYSTFPFSWTWACCMTLLSWPFLPMMATNSATAIDKCIAARFLFIVNVWQLVGALVIYVLAFVGWRRHEDKVLQLVARRQNLLMNSTDDILGEARYRSQPGSVDNLLTSSPSPIFHCGTNQQHPYYVSCPYSPNLAESTLAVGPTESGTSNAEDNRQNEIRIRNSLNDNQYEVSNSNTYQAV